ncbi:MAG: hypothetical protein OXD42_15050 [Rhodospirillaceae bacterium]|nr:hypothetical protein [Rhodospirillaceae bacterium]
MNRRLLQEAIGGSAVQSHKTDCGAGGNIAEPVCVQSVPSDKDRQRRAKENQYQL